MEFQDVVRKRKMVRSFEDRPIPPEIVERIVANVQKAPSAGFSQGWGFLVLEGKDAARYWDELWPEDRRADWGWPDLFKAPLLIVCLSNKMSYLRRYAESDKGWTDMDEKRWPVPYWDVDTGMAALLDWARCSSASSTRRSSARRSVSRMSTWQWASSRWVMPRRRIGRRHRSNAGTGRPQTSCAAAAGLRPTAGARRKRRRRTHLRAGSAAKRPSRSRVPWRPAQRRV